MPAERTAMRQVREVLRLKFIGGVPSREIARRVGVAPSTVRETIRRFINPRRKYVPTCTTRRSARSARGRRRAPLARAAIAG
jgi:IS30 family transposase